MAGVLENSSKHYTKEEIKQRSDAENSVMPRGQAKIKSPDFLKQDKVAKRYFNNYLRKLNGLDLLDILDAETFGIYCSMLSRRDDLSKLLSSVTSEAMSEEIEADTKSQLLSSAADLSRQLRSMETLILSYADKLGFTPSARARLARQRVSDEEAQPVDDLFG